MAAPYITHVIDNFQARLNISDKQLATHMGSLVRTLKEVKKNYRLLKLPHIIKIAKAFKIEPVMLMFLLQRNKMTVQMIDVLYIRNLISDITDYPENPFSYYMEKRRLSETAAGRSLGVCTDTIRKYVRNWELLNMEQLETLGGLFGVEALALFYQLQEGRKRAQKPPKKYVPLRREIGENETIQGLKY